MQIAKVRQLHVLTRTTTLLALFLLTKSAFAEKLIKAELNTMWQEMSKTIAAGDFVGYRATFHQDATLVLGEKETSYHIDKAFKRWKSGFDKVKSGQHKVKVEFRFSKRIYDHSTAHETGMYYHELVDEHGDKTVHYVNLEALSMKVNGKWRVVMEYQKSTGNYEQWASLDVLE